MYRRHTKHGSGPRDRRLVPFRRLGWRVTSVPLFLTVLAACSDSTGPGSDSPADRSLAGGQTTIEDATSHAFSTPAPNLDGDRLALHLDGDLAFEQLFVTPPAQVNPGLGPVFNEASCITCHPRDGRDRVGLLIRVSRPGTGAHGGPLPVEGLGGQIQDKAVIGVQPEAQIVESFEEKTVTLADGTVVVLRRPIISLGSPSAPLPGDLLLSPRMPRPVFGLGLLEAVAEEILLQLEDPADADGDGISGRVNRVWNVQTQRTEVGRFGWKANQPTLLQQTARAYQQDIGVTTTLFPTESSFGQPADDGREDDPELTDEILEAATFYVQTLAVPAPRDVNSPQVRRGEALFEQIKCASCHTPTLETGTLEGVPEVSHQTIHPYTDLLLHDMGPDLADGRPDFLANGREWRTPPLWGIGLTRVVNGRFRLLHDGRARSILEAILWHGGEAEDARLEVEAMSAADLEALLAFLESL